MGTTNTAMNRVLLIAAVLFSALAIAHASTEEVADLGNDNLSTGEDLDDNLEASIHDHSLEDEEDEEDLGEGAGHGGVGSFLSTEGSFTLSGAAGNVEEEELGEGAGHGGVGAFLSTEGSFTL